MKARFVKEFLYENLNEFERGGSSPLATIGVGKGGLLKRKLLNDNAWTEDKRDQLLWSIKNDEISFVVYLFENDVWVGKIGWKWIDQIRDKSDDMNEILWYYRRKGNLTDSRIQYFKEKYKEYGI